MPKDKQESEKDTSQDMSQDEDTAMEALDHRPEDDEILIPGYYRYIH